MLGISAHSIHAGCWDHERASWQSGRVREDHIKIRIGLASARCLFAKNVVHGLRHVTPSID